MKVSILINKLKKIKSEEIYSHGIFDIYQPKIEKIRFVKLYNLRTKDIHFEEEVIFNSRENRKKLYKVLNKEKLYII